MPMDPVRPFSTAWKKVVVLGKKWLSSGKSGFDVLQLAVEFSFMIYWRRPWMPPQKFSPFPEV
jgi:hypothetical protein